MKYMNRFSTLALAFVVAWPAVGSDDFNNNNNNVPIPPAVVPVRHVIAWSEIDNVIKRNPFKKEETIAAYIERLNRLKAQIEGQTLRFRPDRCDQEWLDKDHRTNLILNYGLDSTTSPTVDKQEYPHKIVFHTIQHVHDTTPINIIPSGVLAFDEKWQVREIKHALRWNRLPEELEKFPAFKDVNNGQYLQLVYAELAESHFVYVPSSRQGRVNYPALEGTVPKQFPVIAGHMRPAEEGQLPNYFYDYSSSTVVTEDPEFVYINSEGHYFETGSVELYLSPLCKLEIGNAVSLKKNGDAVKFCKVVRKNKLNHAPFIIDGRQREGFYKVQRREDTSEGVVLILQRQLDLQPENLTVTIPGVKVNGQWAAPLPTWPDVVPVGSVLDLSSIIGKMQAKDYKELTEYLKYARWLGMDSLTLKCHPHEARRIDWSFFNEAPLAQQPNNPGPWTIEDTRFYDKYWLAVDKLMQTLGDQKWLNFDFVAGSFFVTKLEGAMLSSEQRSRILQRVEGKQQIHLPRVPIHHPDLLLGLINRNEYHLTSLDFTGATGLGACGDNFCRAIRECSSLKFLSVIKSDLTPRQCRRITPYLVEEYGPLYCYYSDSKGYQGWERRFTLTELKMSLPTSAWPQTLRTPAACFENWYNDYSGDSRILSGVYTLGGTLSVAFWTPIGFIADVVDVIAGHPVFPGHHDSLKSYLDIIEMKSLEKLTLDIGGDRRKQDILRQDFAQRREAFRKSQHEKGNYLPSIAVIEFME